MKALLIFLAFCPFGALHSEGIASGTSITPENLNQLPFHVLKVTRSSTPGISYINLLIRTEDSYPLQECRIVVYDQRGERILFKVEPTIRKLPEGDQVSFYVADDLIGSTVVNYHLDAGKMQVHSFRIDKGQLPKLPISNINKDAEQGGTEQPATRSKSESEDSDKPQPESEGRSR